MADAFLLLLRQKFDFLWNVSPHVFSDGRGPTLKRFSESPDQLFRTFAADVLWRSIQNVCQLNRHWHVLAFEQQIIHRLLPFVRVQRRLDIERYGMWKSFLFLFRIQWSFFEIMLPTLDQFETLVKNRPPSIQRSCKLHLSCQPSPALVCLFRKRPLPCAVLENTLDSHANGSHGTETPRLFPNKDHPLDILQFFFPHLGHTFDDGYAHPSIGLVFRPADRLSRIRPVAVERFFVISFRRLDSLS